jgi:hypothetical protein
MGSQSHMATTVPIGMQAVRGAMHVAEEPVGPVHRETDMADGLTQVA